jgi:hypothetical protein
MLRDNRSAEISRLIGRSLRSVVDMEALGKHTITIDCDVIQADGGTRCASITGGFVALALAVRWLMENGRITENPIRDYVAATSAGLWNNELILDLEYEEDCVAETDANFVVSGSGKFVEIQATGEAHPFDRDQLSELMDMAGVLWPRIANAKSGICLTALGSVKEEITDVVKVAYDTMKIMIGVYPELISERYGVDVDIKESEDEGYYQDPYYDLFLAMAKKRGCIMSGGRIDEERFARLFLNDLREGRMGRITLELPEDFK